MKETVLDNHSKSCFFGIFTIEFVFPALSEMKGRLVKINNFKNRKTHVNQNCYIFKESNMEY